MPEKFDVVSLGYELDGRIMENGEKRFRLRAPDGRNYIRTEAGPEGVWQNAHHHHGVRETYIVERGWICVAEQSAGGPSVRTYREGEVFTSEPYVDHNVFMPPGAVIHTVQHGEPIGNPDRKGNDWWPAPEAFDQWSKQLDIAVIVP